MLISMQRAHEALSVFPESRVEAMGNHELNALLFCRGKGGVDGALLVRRALDDVSLPVCAGGDASALVGHE